GHIGNSWDCWGCHGFQESSALSSLDSLQKLDSSLKCRPTAPEVDKVIPNEITAGQDTVITIYGTSFINECNGTIYTSNVTLDNGTVTIEREPDSITSTVIEVTIPGTLESGIYDLRVVKDGDMSSNKVTLAVIPDVQIEMVTIPG
ncbi:MAG: IPT/TIG domain-containing protein, partial [Methanosarcinales archaeon]|nr:IPT/TIG domain-containing protein [Methanosarcinales archaeon]